MKLRSSITSTLVVSIAMTVLSASELNASVIVQEDFESGSLSKAQNGFTWGDHSSAGVLGDTTQMLAAVTTTMQSIGAYALQFHFYGNALPGQADAEQRFTFTNKGASPSTNYRDLWMRFKLYVPSNYYHRNNSPANNKFLWFWSGNYNAPNNDYFGYQYVAVGTHPSKKGDGSSALETGWTASAAIGQQALGGVRQNPNDADAYNTYSGSEVLLIDTTKDLNTWVDIAVHITAATYRNSGAYPATLAGDGVLEIWKNGQKIWNVHNMGNYYYDPANPQYSGFQHGYLLGYANSGFTQDTYMAVDNLVFGTTAADINLTSPPNPPTLNLTVP